MGYIKCWNMRNRYLLSEKEDCFVPRNDEEGECLMPRND